MRSSRSTRSSWSIRRRLHRRRADPAGAHHVRTHQLVVALVLTLVLLAPDDAAAQAWVPLKGEGAVSVLYQDIFVEDHFFDRGQRLDRGSIGTQNLLIDFTYGITDRLAIAVGVPFVSTRYIGRAPH